MIVCWNVATGTGNAALLSARRGGRVTGVDFEPSLLQVAERRADRSGCEVRWLLGDVAALPVPDDSADVVLSVFGVMCATDHDAAVRELARVAARQARIALASWVPDSVMPAMGRVLSAYLPPPPSSTGPPSRWGDPDTLRGLLEPHGLHLVAASTRRLILHFSDPAAGCDFLVRTAGHVVAERERLSRAGRWDDLCQDLSQLVEEHAEHAVDGLHLPLDFLLASATNTPRLRS